MFRGALFFKSKPNALFFFSEKNKKDIRNDQNLPFNPFKVSLSYKIKKRKMRVINNCKVLINSFYTFLQSNEIMPTNWNKSLALMICRARTSQYFEFKAQYMVCVNIKFWKTNKTITNNWFVEFMSLPSKSAWKEKCNHRIFIFFYFNGIRLVIRIAKF